MERNAGSFQSRTDFPRTNYCLAGEQISQWHYEDFYKAAYLLPPNDILSAFHSSSFPLFASINTTRCFGVWLAQGILMLLIQ